MTRHRATMQTCILVVLTCTRCTEKLYILAAWIITTKHNCDRLCKKRLLPIFWPNQFFYITILPCIPTDSIGIFQLILLEPLVQVSAVPILSYSLKCVCQQSNIVLRKIRLNGSSITIGHFCILYVPPFTLKKWTHLQLVRSTLFQKLST